MLGTYLPLIALPALALVVGLRRPPQVESGRASVADTWGPSAVAVALLVAFGWVCIVAATKIRDWGCPGGFDGAGVCTEPAAWDFGPAGVVMLALPLAAAVALALSPRKVHATTDASSSSVAKRNSLASREAVVSTSEDPHDSSESAQPETAKIPASDVATADGQADPTPLEGDVVQAFIGGEPATLMHAMRQAVSRIGQRPGVVFSAHANNEANDALAELAVYLNARRYLASPEEAGKGAPNFAGAKQAAGFSAAHASELALDLAGGAIDSLIMLDARMEMSPLALAALSRAGSICVADAHNEVTRAIDIVLPAPPFAIDGGHITNASGVREPMPSDETERTARAGVVQRLRVALGGQQVAPPPASFVPPLAGVPDMPSVPSVPSVPSAPNVEFAPPLVQDQARDQEE